MKTRTMMLTVVAAVVTSVAAWAADPTDPKVAVISRDASTFKLIYQGEVKGNVNLAIYDQAGTIVYAGTIKSVEGFICPLNFKGMEAGEYTIKVAGKAGSVSQKINYLRAASAVK